MTADYGGGWLWVISLAGEHDETLVLTMQNVSPAAHATEGVRAGPYVAMLAELRRAG